MSRWVWPVVSMASIVAAVAADRLFWPDRVNVGLYVIPSLLASKRLSPGGVLVVAAVCLLVAIYGLYLTKEATPYGAVSLAALVAVGFLATSHALHRQKLLRKLQRQQAVIDMVQRLRQPITVIVGYSQLLQTRPRSETTLSAALDAIRRAALHLRDLLDDILDKGGTV
jgi:signal transduction histidine kinase